MQGNYSQCFSHTKQAIGGLSKNQLLVFKGLGRKVAEARHEIHKDETARLKIKMLVSLIGRELKACHSTLSRLEEADQVHKSHPSKHGLKCVIFRPASPREAEAPISTNTLRLASPQDAHHLKFPPS
jgi:hypothetical protein